MRVKQQPVRTVQGGTDGISTETGGRETGDPNFYLSDVDKRIVENPSDGYSNWPNQPLCKINPQFIWVKYYSDGYTWNQMQYQQKLEAMLNGASVSLPVDDLNMFTLDDTIGVVGVSAITKPDGTKYTEDDSNVPDLVLCVRKGQLNKSSYSVCRKWQNGWFKQTADSCSGNSTRNNVCTAWEKHVGNGCSTGRFNNIPMPETQYCQNFMIQVEQSTLTRLPPKEVNWNFSDIEEDGVYDMRLAMENTYLFGVKQVIKHIARTAWTLGLQVVSGGWPERTSSGRMGYWQEMRHNYRWKPCGYYQRPFVGTGIGNKRKILFCGSDMLSAFSKIKSEKFRLKDTVEVWNLKFKSWDTDFGEVIDHTSWTVRCKRNEWLRLCNGSGISFQKHMCLGHVTYSTKGRYPPYRCGSYPRGELPVSALCKAHARMRLAKAPAKI